MAAAEGKAAPVESERLLLRALDESDEQLYCDLFSNAETMRYIGPPWARDDAARAFPRMLVSTRCTPPTAVALTLIVRETRDAIGICTLQNFEPSPRRAELGMMLLPSGRAHGFATEALIAVLGYSFAALPIDEVWVRFAADHAIAERTALGGGLVRHQEVLPADAAAKLCRWSAFRGSWRPRAALDAVTDLNS
jgi:RimJ/RimL family protein N-acetyltransferase